MRGVFLVFLLGCNSDPLYLPEVHPDMSRISHAIVACSAGQCDTGQACCTHDDGINGTCVPPTSDPGVCYALIQCDGPEDCDTGEVCCDSQLRFNGLACSSSCDDINSTVACHTDADCPANAAKCCSRTMNGPLSHCLPYCWG